MVTSCGSDSGPPLAGLAGFPKDVRPPPQGFQRRLFPGGACGGGKKFPPLAASELRGLGFPLEGPYKGCVGRNRRRGCQLGSTPRSVRHIARNACWIHADGIAGRVRELRRLHREGRMGASGDGKRAFRDPRDGCNVRRGAGRLFGAGCWEPGRRTAAGRGKPLMERREVTPRARMGLKPVCAGRSRDQGCGAAHNQEGAAYRAARTVRMDTTRGLAPPPFETLDKGVVGGRRRGLERTRS